MFDKILMGISLILTFQNMLVIVAGTVLGITFGALPGFTASMGVAVLIPLTFGMSPVAGLALLGSVYCGAIYGGSITAILIATPGTPAAAATALDGYEMTKKGMAGEALKEATVASFWGGIISALALLLIAPALANFALKFGPPEMFMLAIFGLTIIVTLTSDSLLKGIISGIIGLIIGTVGMDPLIGYPRFEFGQVSLLTGIQLVPALIGLYSMSQVFMLILQGNQQIINVDVKNVKTSKPTLKDMIRYPIVYLRSALIGTFVGALPAAGASIAAFIGYNEGKRFSKTPNEFGKGCREAVASAEAANNGVTGGSLITTLTLGIPGNSTTAILLGGLMIQGLRTGHELFTTNANVAYPFIISLFLANFVMLIVGLFGAKYFANISKTPINMLTTIIFVLGVLGSYAVTNNMFDVYIMMFFGLLGFLLKVNNFEASPIVLGMILGPIAEQGMNQSLVLAKDRSLIGYFSTRPIVIVLFIFIVISLFAPILRDRKFIKRIFNKNQATSIEE